MSLVTSKAYETQHLYINIIIQGLTRNKCNYTRSHTFYIYHALLAKDNHAQLPHLVKVCDLSFETYWSNIAIMLICITRKLLPMYKSDQTWTRKLNNSGIAVAGSSGHTFILTVSNLSSLTVLCGENNVSKITSPNQFCALGLLMPQPGEKLKGGSLGAPQKQVC